MIPGNETNKVYFSELICTKYSKTFNELANLLNKHCIEYDFIKSTKDIWCRDYMPIQIEMGKFVQFRYEPSYLKDDLELQSDPKEVCKANNIIHQFSKINLDGGNIVNCSDRAIISDRIFSENPEYINKSKLISDIEKLLELEVIIIPHIKNDLTGHADGMVRFINRNKIIGNNRSAEYKCWTKEINKILKNHNIEYIDIPFYSKKDKKNPYNAEGCYVNYLEVKNLIIIPIFEKNLEIEKEVYSVFKDVFNNRIIETLNFYDIGLEGGLLNCCTWTIKT
jgi:agmatine deiminase